MRNYQVIAIRLVSLAGLALLATLPAPALSEPPTYREPGLRAAPLPPGATQHLRQARLPEVRDWRDLFRGWDALSGERPAEASAAGEQAGHQVPFRALRIGS